MLLVSYIQQYFYTSITVLTNQVWKLLIALFKVPNTGAFTVPLSWGNVGLKGHCSFGEGLLLLEIKYRLFNDSIKFSKSYRLIKVFSTRKATQVWKILDCFHTTAKCVFWILIRNAHFELRSVHTIESNCEFWIATQCTHERPNFGFCIPAGEGCLGTLPIKHAWSSHFLCFCTIYRSARYIGGSG